MPNINISDERRRALRAYKSRHDETYDEAIERLLESVGAETSIEEADG